MGSTAAQRRHHFFLVIFLFVTSALILNSCDSNKVTGGTSNNLLKITGISPDSGFVGAAVRISGKGFAPQASGNNVTFGGGVAAEVQPAGPHSLLVHVPKGAVSGPVKLTIAGKTVTGHYFKVLTHGPSITSVSPLKGSPGTQVTIRGRHFLAGVAAGTADSSGAPQEAAGTTDSLLSDQLLPGKASGSTTINLPSTRVTIPSARSEVDDQNGQIPSPMTIAVTVGGVLAPILSINEIRIIIKIPEGAGNGPIIVSVGGQSDSWTNFQVVAAPVITTMTPKQGPIGTTITLTGTGFSSTPDSNAVTFNGTQANVSKASTTQLTVTVPKGATSGPVKVTANGQTSTGPTFTMTEASGPQVSITDVSPKEGPVGTSVTITGQNFSATKADNKVTFNGTKTVVSSASTTKLVVTVPSGTTTGVVKVQANGQTATGPTFTVTATPVPQVEISGISPKSGLVGASVTITGKNFSADKAKNTVTFNGTEATVTKASTTELTVTVPNSTTSGLVKVQANGQTATGPTFTVTVNHPPAFTDAPTAYNIDENTTAVATLTTADSDGDAVTYTLSGGADRSKFTIGNTSGTLAFTAPPDYETPKDKGGDNVYHVQVQAGDGTLAATRALTVTVLNAAEKPVLKSAVITAGAKTFSESGSSGTYAFENVSEGTDLSGGSLTITVEDDVDPISQVTVGGTDGSDFTVTTKNDYTLSLNGPVLDYTHSAGHTYGFSLTLENTAGQTVIWSFTIQVLPFAGGSGTKSKPYKVATLAQLQRVGQSQFLNDYFIQVADIDASSTAGWNGGKGFVPIGNGYNFSGGYDGGGHIISGLTIHRPGTDYIGLFGIVRSGGAVNAVYLREVDITGGGRTGGLVGDNEGNITASYTTGKITGEYGAGGLVGDNEGSITASYAAAAVTAYGTGAIAGGLVGKNNGSVTDSYATGTVTGKSGAYYVGGLVGYNWKSITRSYATGKVTGDAGLVANNDGGSIKNSYWDTQSTDQSNSDGGTGLTTSEMQGTAAKANMDGFDFINVWQTVSGGYPILQWQP